MIRPIRNRLRRRRRRQVKGQAVILMYHSISSGRPDPWDLCVAPDLFAQQLQVLHEGFRVVSLTELRRAVVAGEPPSHGVVITFDDGYRDNLLVAKPLLEEHGLPATVFVTTGYVGASRDFWWDELEALAASTGVASRELWEELQALGHEERLARLAGLWASAGSSPPEPSLRLSHGELERLAAGPLIRLGAHTATHPHLSALPPAAQRHEIEASRSYLAEITDRPIEDFSYPHGDFSQETLALVTAAGFESACTTHSTPVTRQTSRFELPRIQVGNWDGDGLERELKRRLV
jgi:peptidoglycan/xylan/chitin deacetylase (PgdA/CDA1 family)